MSEALKGFLVTLAVLAGILICHSLCGCSATVKTFDPVSGKVVTEAKIPLSMQFDTETKTISGDPKAIEALGVAGTKALEVSGEAVTRFAIEKYAETQAASASER